MKVELTYLKRSRDGKRVMVPCVIVKKESDIDWIEGWLGSGIRVPEIRYGKRKKDSDAFTDRP